MGLVAAAIVTLATPLGTAIWSLRLQLPEPGDLAGDDRVGARDPVDPRDRLPPDRDRSRGLAVVAIADATAADAAARGRRLPRVRRALDAQPDLRRPRPGVPDRLLGARPLHAPSPAPWWPCAAGAALGGRASPTPRCSARLETTRPVTPSLRYALKHPPKHGRIAAYAGASSYVLWRSPRHAGGDRRLARALQPRRAPRQLRHPARLARGIPPGRSIGSTWVRVIAHLPGAIQALKAHGFRVAYAGGGSVYLVRPGRPAFHQIPVLRRRRSVVACASGE